MKIKESLKQSGKNSAKALKKGAEYLTGCAREAYKATKEYATRNGLDDLIREFRQDIKKTISAPGVKYGVLPLALTAAIGIGYITSHYTPSKPLESTVKTRSIEREDIKERKTGTTTKTEEPKIKTGPKQQVDHNASERIVENKHEEEQRDKNQQRNPITNKSNKSRKIEGVLKNNTDTTPNTGRTYEIAPGVSFIIPHPKRDGKSQTNHPLVSGDIGCVANTVIYGGTRVTIPAKKYFGNLKAHYKILPTGTVIIAITGNNREKIVGAYDPNKKYDSGVIRAFFDTNNNGLPNLEVTSKKKDEVEKNVEEILEKIASDDSNITTPDKEVENWFQWNIRYTIDNLSPESPGCRPPRINF